MEEEGKALLDLKYSQATQLEMYITTPEEKALSRHELILTSDRKNKAWR